MKANWDQNENNRGVLTVEVDEEKLGEALNQAFKKVVKDVNLPGFRKGKVPRPIFEKRFGVEALYQDAVEILVPEAYQSAVEETGELNLWINQRLTLSNWKRELLSFSKRR